jgi:hypothetical protein
MLAHGYCCGFLEILRLGVDRGGPTVGIAQPQDQNDLDELKISSEPNSYFP